VLSFLYHFAILPSVHVLKGMQDAFSILGFALACRSDLAACISVAAMLNITLYLALAWRSDLAA
jgi:hypothetical protein